MKTYGFQREKIEYFESELKKRVFILAIPIIILSMIMALLLKVSIILYTLFLVCGVTASIFGFNENLKKYRAFWRDLKIEVGDDNVCRKCGTEKIILIDKEKIVSVVENSKGIMVRSNNSDQTIFIPKEINDYDILRMEIQKYAEIKAFKDTNDPDTKIMFSVGITFLIYVILMYFEQKPVKVSGSILAFLAMLSIGWYIYKTNGFTEKSKKMFGFIAIITVLIVVRIFTI